MVKSLRFLKGQLTRAEARVKKVDTLSVYSLKHYLDELEKDYVDLESWYNDRELNEAEEEELLEYQDKYAFAQARLREAVDRKLNRDPGDSFEHHSNTDPAFTALMEKQSELFETVNNLVKVLPQESRLPALKIPIFSGDYKHWNGFKNLFLNRIGRNDKLTDTVKLGHLISLLSGEAAGLIKHLQLEEENFAPAWEALEKKYNKPYRIGMDIIGNFRKSMEGDIKLRNIASFCNTFTETFLALDNVSTYSQSRDIWIVSSVVEHFDRFLKEKWANHISGNSEPSVETMQEFLTEFAEISLDRGEEKISRDSGEKIKFLRKESSLKSASIFVGSCFVCRSDHKIFNCEKFKSLSVQERDKLVKSANRCFNCLGTGHSVKVCKSSHSCNHCRKKHHSLLHFESPISNQPKGHVPNSTECSSVQNENGIVRIHSSFSKDVSAGLLPTALVQVIRGDGVNSTGRIMLDTGAQSSFVSEAFARRMNLRVQKSRVPIRVISSDQVIYSKGYVTVSLSSRYDKNSRCTISAHVLETLTGSLPGVDLVLKKGKYLYEKFLLADPNFDVSSEIDLIVGVNHFFEIIGGGKYYQSFDNFYIIESLFGWVVAGGSNYETPTSLNAMRVNVEDEPYEKMIERFWDLDDMNSTDQLNEDHIVCEKNYEDTTTRESSGRYSVSLPLKPSKSMLGESYFLALRRFYNLERKLNVDAALGTEYRTVINSFIKLGYLELVPIDSLSVPIYERFYLPHYAIKSGSPEKSKIRIVFDASMKSENGVSLNDVLHTGPNLQLNLMNILTKFSIHPFVFSADISKMYRQIKINASCRDYQRILWRDTVDNQLKQYRLTTVTDGMSCSPFLALRTIEQLIEDEGDMFPLGAEAMSQHYMDDFFVGDDSLSRLREKKVQLIRILERGGMSLGKWASNRVEVIEDVEYKTYVSINECSIVKTLGVLWNPDGDYFGFKFERGSSKTFSKRSLLSESATIFDPAGWISPVTVLIKKLFQGTWIRQIGWDDSLPNDIESAWIKIRNELSCLNEIKFPRWIGEGEVVHLHGFCDASNLAYAAVVYSKTISSDGVVVTRLLCSKTRVAPLKPISIARLELCGAHLLAKLVKSILPVFSGIKFTIKCWSDSTTVLAWLKSSPNRWASFVANRCGAIHELIPGVSWEYVRSSNNAADIVSRGAFPSELVGCKSWWDGPSWLIDFVETSSCDTDFTTEEEMKRSVKANVVTVLSFFESFVSRFSSLTRLRRTFAYMKRCIRSKKSRISGELNTQEIDESFTQLVKVLQHEAFSEEIKSIKQGKNLNRSSRIANLSPMLDESGLLRVGGRLGNSNITYEQKHPIILVKSHLVDLILDYLHLKYHHAGCKLLLSIFRSRFYAARLRPMIKNSIGRCQTCIRFVGRTYQPIMGQLPSFRFSNEKPFFHCGVDFAGPLLVRPYKGRGKITLKSYIAIFVCMNSKAVHLELVMGLDTASLILAIKRFVSRRGRCAVMHSDNGKNFVGCAKIMTRLKQDIKSKVDDKCFQQFLSENLMEWNFIPCYSPTFGGVWEAGVKSIKYHLYRSLNGRTPTIEEMITFLNEIECILNSRPIAGLKEEVDGSDILTPAHLLNGYPLAHVPLCETSDSVKLCDKLIPRYVGLRKALASFWGCWRNEFFNDHMKMTKWFCKGLEPQVGDLVLIRRKNEPPTYWSRGRIKKLYEGTDHVIRVVDVMSERGLTRETARNLVPLKLKIDSSTGGV